MDKEQKEKKVSISIDPEVIKNSNTYSEQLIKITDQNGFEIHFANTTETNDLIQIDIKEVIKIPADKMKSFCMNIVDALCQYEKNYKNGLGFNFDENENEDE